LRGRGTRPGVASFYGRFNCHETWYRSFTQPNRRLKPYSPSGQIFMLIAAPSTLLSYASFSPFSLFRNQPWCCAMVTTGGASLSTNHQSPITSHQSLLTDGAATVRAATPPDPHTAPYAPALLLKAFLLSGWLTPLPQVRTGLGPTLDRRSPKVFG
jgi:hypothetical protein